MWILGDKVFKAASLNIVNEPKEKNQIILKLLFLKGVCPIVTHGHFYQGGVFICF